MAPASPVPVVIPEHLWEPQEGEEAVLVEWLVEDGAAVQEGQRIAQIMVDKVTLDVEAPVAGRLAIAAPVDTPVHLGAEIATIYSGADDA